MIASLISLAIVCVVVGIVLLIVKLLIDKIPMDGTFRQIAWLLCILVAVLIVLYRALPLIGVSI